MDFRIDLVTDIAAPPAMVWQVITDLPRYRTWNPFVVACDSSLLPGTPIHMRVNVLPWFAQSQTETILEHRPGVLLSYGVTADALGALASCRSHTLEPLADGSCRYHSRFHLQGWLAPVVKTLLGRQLQRGFREMTAALKVEAEKRSGQVDGSSSAVPAKPCAGTTPVLSE